MYSCSRQHKGGFCFHKPVHLDNSKQQHIAGAVEIVLLMGLTRGTAERITVIKVEGAIHQDDSISKTGSNGRTMGRRYEVGQMSGDYAEVETGGSALVPTNTPTELRAFSKLAYLGSTNIALSGKD